MRDSLSTEIALIERARHALLLQQPQDTLHETERYERTASAHVLSSEAQLLRVEALQQLGQHRAAIRLARHLLDSDPNGTHAAKLREFLPEATPE
jgi:hypothetical protein